MRPLGKFLKKITFWYQMQCMKKPRTEPDMKGKPEPEMKREPETETLQEQKPETVQEVKPETGDKTEIKNEILAATEEKSESGA